MIDDALIELRWRSTSYAEETGESDRFIYPYQGHLYSIRDNTGQGVLFGRFRAFYVDVVRLSKEDESVWDALDCHSEAMASYFLPIFGDAAPEFSDTVFGVCKTAIEGENLLILDRLEIFERFRGYGFGLRAMRQMMVCFSPGAGLIAIKPYPLQFEAGFRETKQSAWSQHMRFDRFGKDQEAATQKLQAYYGQLGFVTLPDSDFMVFATGWHIPSALAVESVPNHG